MASDRQSTEDACDLLLVAAFAPELERLSGELDGDLRGLLGPMSVRALTCGIGLVTAAATTAAAHLEQIAPARVILLGTCGRYPTSPGEGRAEGRAKGGEAGGQGVFGPVVVSRALALVDLAASLGESECPEPMGMSLEADPALASSLVFGDAAPGLVATTLGVTVDDSAARRIRAATGADVEHMETFGVAVACAARAVPFAAVLGVSNEVGSRGREDWRSHHREAAAAACEHVIRWALAGGTGRRDDADGLRRKREPS